MIPNFQDFFFWDYQRNQNCSPSYLGFSYQCTWSLCLKTCLSSWLSDQTHVLLPLQPVLCRHLFHLHHHPKDAVKHPDREQRYHLSRLHHPDVFFHSLCLLGQLSPSFDGLCPLLHHLSPPALQYHPEPPALWTSDAGVLDLKCPKFPVTKLNNVIVLCTDMETPHFFCDLNQMFKLWFLNPRN